MTYLLKKSEVNQTLRGWISKAHVYAPQKVQKYAQFLPVGEDFELSVEEPHNTRFPPKALFLPQSETLLKYNPQKRELESAETPDQPRIIFGIRPCDAKAVTLLDSVFSSEDNHDPFWQARRDQSVLVGLGCDQPCATCFCTSVESGPFDRSGLDAILTDLGDTYAVEPLTERGVSLFENLTVASAETTQTIQAIQEKATREMPIAFGREGLKAHLDELFENEIWEDFAKSCLGCGICTFLCPTCFCFDIVDEVRKSTRERNWDTCMFKVYSIEASGHNPRPSRRERTRQRLMHKYSYWLDHTGQTGCTGCGRCVRYCPVGLDIRAMVRKSVATPSEVPHVD